MCIWLCMLCCNTGMLQSAFVQDMLQRGMAVNAQRFGFPTSSRRSKRNCALVSKVLCYTCAISHQNLVLNSIILHRMSVLMERVLMYVLVTV
jgi:hypothetical protein